MKIAIYNSLAFHFEMLGYIIDYLINFKINFNIYSYYDKEWKLLYNKIFNINKYWFDPININISNYDYVFLITDDDHNIYYKLHNINYNKLICINHYEQIRRTYNVCEYINTRFFYNSSIKTWALPCYRLISKIEKYNLLINNNINIACIGIHNMPVSEDYLKNLFDNFNDIHFHLIARKIDVKIIKYSNIKLYINMNTNDMINVLKSCNYILCFNNSYDLIYKCMSGSVHLAFTLGCKLIIPTIWNKYYNFKSCITYDDKIIIDNNLNYLNMLYDEQMELITNRNNIFNNIINNNNIINWYSNIVKTNIIINIGYNISNDIYIQTKYFKIIYGVELNNDNYTYNQYKNNENIFIFNLNNINILLNIINYNNKIILFNFINFNFDYYNFFNLFNKRNIKDFIIVTNYNNFNFNLINKISMFHINNKINKIIIHLF